MSMSAGPLSSWYNFCKQILFHLLWGSLPSPNRKWFGLLQINAWAPPEALELQYWNCLHLLVLYVDLLGFPSISFCSHRVSFSCSWFVLLYWWFLPVWNWWAGCHWLPAAQVNSSLEPGIPGHLHIVFPAHSTWSCQYTSCLRFLLLFLTSIWYGLTWWSWVSISLRKEALWCKLNMESDTIRDLHAHLFNNFLLSTWSKPGTLLVYTEVKNVSKILALTENFQIKWRERKVYP